MIQFTLPFPPSCNTLFPSAGKRRVKSKKYLDWINKASAAMNNQNVTPLSKRCLAVYDLYVPDNRERDAANYEKALTDFLVSRGIICDDNRRHLKGVFVKWLDTKGDKVDVRLYHEDELDL